MKEHLFILIDRSGSMSGSEARHVSGIKEIIQSRQANNTDCNITVAQFDSENAFDIMINNQNVLDIDLNKVGLSPRGATPLYDAIGRMINHARAIATNNNVVMLIVTDGLENSSKEWNLERVKNAISSAKSNEWDITFMGTNIDAVYSGGSMGLSFDKSVDFSQNKAGEVYTSYSNKLNKRSMAIKTGCSLEYANKTMSYTDQDKQDLV